MSDKEIEAIPFREPDKALFDSLEKFRVAMDRRERVDEWIGREQLYGLGEHESAAQSIKRMLGDRT